MGDQWLRLMVMRFAAVAWAMTGFCPPVRGGELPQIVSYSKSEVAVVQGDKVVLEVKASGDNVAVKWVRNDDILCETFRCAFDTTSWGLGDQKVILIVFNPLGSQFVRYAIKVIGRKPESPVSNVHPPLVAKQDHIETVKAEDLVVQIVSGIGYSYNRSKVQVIGNSPRTLSWKERLRTHPEGVLKFGRESVEEHLLLKESIVSLVVSPTGRRGVLLLKGKIRSRQLDEREPAWSLIVSDYAQIDTDSKGDVILEQDELSRGRYILTVLRGNARVVHTATDATGKETGRKIVVVPAGSAVAFRRTVTPDELLAPDPKSIGETVALSTPQWAKGPVQPSLVASKSFHGDLAKLGRSMDEALAKDDAPVSLELGLNAGARAASNFAVAYGLGRAYARVFMYKQATSWLETAQRLQKDNPGPAFELGLIRLRLQDFEKAVSAFDDADSDHYPDSQMVDYYTGLAKFRLGRKLSARNAFTRAMWSDDHPVLTDSAKDFVDAIRLERPFVMHFYGGGGTDNNPFRLSGNTDLPTGIESRNSKFYTVGGGIDYEMFRDEGSYVSVGFGIDRFAYTAADLKEFAQVDQSLGAEIGIALDDAKGPPAAQLIVNSNFGTTLLGSERADDFVRTAVALAFPGALCEPRLIFDSTLHLDPLPAREDLKDIATNETQFAATERTKRTTSYGLSLCSQLGIHHVVGFDYFYELLNMRNADLYSENFKGHRGSLRFHLPFFRRLALVGKLTYKSRAYANSTDSRADKETDVSAALRWYLNPSLHANVFTDYERDSSSRETSAYARTVLGLKFGLDL